MANTIIDSLVVALTLDASQFNKAGTQALQNLKQFAQQAQSQANVAQHNANSFLQMLTKTRLAMLGVAGTIAGAALEYKSFFERIVKSDAALAFNARAIGVSATSLSKWGNAAKAAGGSAEGITAGFAGLSNAIAEFQFTGRPFEGLQWLRMLNINLSDAKGNIKGVDQIFGQAIEEMTRRGYSFQRQKAVLRGIGAPEDFLKIVDAAEQAGMSLDQYLEHVRRTTGVTDESVAAHQKLVRAWGELELHVEGLGRSLEFNLTEKLMAATARVQDLIDKLRGLIDIFKEKGWEGVWNRLQPGPILTPGKPADQVFQFLKKGVQQWGNVLGIGPGTGGLPVQTGGGSGGKTGWWTPERSKFAMDYLQKNAGLSEVASRALVARWSAVEASGGPGSVNPSSGAVGIAQWLGDRKRSGVPEDFEGQLAKAVRELQTTEQRAYNTLKNAKTEQEAAIGASQFERAEGWNGVADAFVNKTVNRMQLLRQQGGVAATPSGLPEVETGAGAAATQHQGMIDNSSTTNTAQNSATHVNIASMTVKTDNAEDFAKQLKPVLEGHSYAAQANYGLA